MTYDEVITEMNAIPMPEYPPMWQQLRPHVEAAIQETDCQQDIFEVLDAITLQEAQWFPGEKSAIVTRTFRRHNDVILDFWLAGGDMEEILTMHDWISRLAVQELGITRARVSGRQGWHRVLKSLGYKAKYVILEKELNHG